MQQVYQEAIVSETNNLKTDMYWAYAKEVRGLDVILRDEGFMLVKPFGEHLYIEEVYIKPEFRRSGVAGQLLDAVVDSAKELGLKKILGSVTPPYPGATESLKVMLHYGFRLYASESDMTYLEKDI